MANKKRGLDYSVVVEWCNALTSEKSRPIDAVKRIVLQMRTLNKSGELLIVCPQDVDVKRLRELIKQTSSGINFRIIATEYTKGSSGLNYKLKNESIFFAKGKIIVFMDSDVIVEPEWLKRMLSPFKHKDIKVVAGITYLDTKDFYHKSMALAWLFPLRNPDGQLYADERFWGNNVAARKEIWEEYTYNIDPYAGSCVVDLSERLVNDGIVIWKQPLARASHPAPNGLSQFIDKALGEGSDIYFRWRRSYRTLLSLALLSGGSLKRIILKNAHLLNNHGKVGMHSAAVPIAWLINIFYCSIVWWGGIIGIMYQLARDLSAFWKGAFLK